MATLEAAARRSRRRRLTLAWGMWFPLVVVLFVVAGLISGDPAGGLRTGMLFGAVIATLISLPGGGKGSQSSSHYVDSGDGDVSCDVSADSTPGNDC